MSESKAVEKRKDALPPATFLEQLDAVGVDGFENVTDDMISLPFLKIAQPNSPELLPGGIDGLRPGSFFNSITGQVYGPEVTMILLGTDKSYLEWEKGSTGKLVNRYTPEQLSDAVAEGKVFKGDFFYTPKDESREIKETHTFFVLLAEYPGDGPMLFSFKSTGIKHVRKWVTKARAMQWQMPDGKMAPAPLYGCVWDVKSVLNKNDQGNWYLIGDAKTLSASRIGTLLDDKFAQLQAPVMAAVGFVKDVQFKVSLAGTRDVTDSAKDDGIPI